MDNTSRIHAADVDVTIKAVGGEDYISLTDMARHEGSRPGEIIRRWLRLSDTISFLIAWERLSNPLFNMAEAQAILAKSGRNVFGLSATDWVSRTGAIGIRSVRGRSGGTYAHKDIAFAFASWISPEFHLFVIKDYQRLKQAEQQRTGIEWHARRELTKTNYRLHTDAVKETLGERDLPKWRERFVYADEADVINLVVFGKTAAEWKAEHRGWRGNMRDYASVRDLVILQNIEALSAMFISQGYDKEQRCEMLKTEADRQRGQLKDDLPSIERLRDIIESTEAIENGIEKKEDPHKHDPDPDNIA